MIEVRPHCATRRFIGGVSILALGIAAEAGAGPARDQLAATTGRLLKIIQRPAYDTQQFKKRRAATQRVLDDLFDWPEMALAQATYLSALNAAWRRRPIEPVPGAIIEWP